MTSRILRLGMVGGGRGAFFGAVHMRAAAMTQRFQLVAGALSSNPEKAAASAADLGINPARSYSSFEDMARTEAGRDDGIDLVAIVTPNHLHAPASRAFLASGIHVMCDKPLTATVAEADSVLRAAEASSSLFGMTYTNVGFDMVREARALVQRGVLGKIRLVRVQFPQEWLASAEENNGNKQAEWRTDPARSGAGSLGDIGTHAFHLAEFVSGLRCVSVSADVDTFVEGRKVDDNALINLRFENGAKGSMWISQIAIGETNGLRIEIIGDRASLAWGVEKANILHLCEIGRRRTVIDRASHDTIVAGMMPPGHPQGFVEALAVLYSDMADQIEARLAGEAPDTRSLLLPGIADGVRGMRFIDATLRSGLEDGRWIEIDTRTSRT